MIKVKLLRQLDGRAEGETAEYPELDAKRLEEMGVVDVIEEKAAPAANNKMALAPHNKDVQRPTKQKGS